MKEKKDKQILILIEESKREEFQTSCAYFKTTQSKALRSYIDVIIENYREALFNEGTQLEIEVEQNNKEKKPWD